MSDRSSEGSSHPSSRVRNSLPLRGKQDARPRRVILAAHLVWTGYGHWLPNDPRGSGSEEIRQEKLQDLGEIHQGRKPVQPPRAELREFYREAEERLEHDVLWFNDSARSAMADAVQKMLQVKKYTLWAFALCKNHGHAVVRTHRDGAEIIWGNLAEAMRVSLRETGIFAVEHPVWSHRPYKVFLHSSEDVEGRIGYVEDNPEKEGLRRQRWPFVVPFRG